MTDFLCESLCLAQSACAEIGATCQFVVRTEANVSRDKFESIKAYQNASTYTYNICAMEIEFTPNERQLSEAGLYENAEVAIKTPTKQWFDLGVGFGDIDIKRTSVTLGGETYKIKEKGRVQIITGTTPLFFSFGLVKN